jgi:hypothetical protein
MEDLGEFAFLRKKSTNTDFFKTYVRSFVERDNLKNKVKRLLINNIIND